MNIVKGIILIITGFLSVLPENDITFLIFALLVGGCLIGEGIKEVREEQYDEQRKNYGHVR